MNDKYLHPRERQCVLQPVFTILLRVGVQHYVVHLVEDMERGKKKEESRKKKEERRKKKEER